VLSHPEILNRLLVAKGQESYLKSSKKRRVKQVFIIIELADNLDTILEFFLFDNAEFSAKGKGTCPVCRKRNLSILICVLWYFKELPAKMVAR